MMNYKGYIGQVEFDDENHVFTGRVINTKTVITFHGETVKELEKEFKTSVDEYLKWCKEDGTEPEKPYSGNFNVRFTPELHKQASLGAKTIGLSLNKFVEQSVCDKLREMNMTEKYEENSKMEITNDGIVDIASKSVLKKYHKAFEELAK